MATLKIRACRNVQEEASERAPERRSLAGFRRVRRGPRRASCARCGGLRWWVRGRRKNGPHRPQAWRGDDCARRGLAALKLNEMLNGPGPAGRPRPGRVVAAGRGHAAGGRRMPGSRWPRRGVDLIAFEPIACNAVLGSCGLPNGGLRALRRKGRPRPEARSFRVRST